MFGDIADTSSAWILAAYWEAIHALARGVGDGRSGESLYGLRCWRERTGASFAVGSGSARTLATSGWGAGRRVTRRWRSDRGGRTASPSKSTAEVEARVLAARAMPSGLGRAQACGAGWQTQGRSAFQRPRRCTRSCAVTAGWSLPSSSAERAHLRFETASAERSVADGLQGLGDAHRRPGLPSADHRGRPLALCVPCLEACADEQGETVRGHLESSLPPLRPARSDLRRQRLALGRRLGRALDLAGRVAAQARHRSDLRAPLPSAEPRQERALPPHPQGRGLRVPALPPASATCSAPSTLGATVYNFERPHEALGPGRAGQPLPAEPRGQCPERLRPSTTTWARYVRTVSSTKDYISFKGQLWKVPQAFRGERVAIRPLSQDGRYGVFFASQQDRHHRLDQPSTCQRCLRTGVSHVPGLNN